MPEFGKESGETSVEHIDGAPLTYLARRASPTKTSRVLVAAIDTVADGYGSRAHNFA
jgi:hypothetical protein